jgi:hypothetical protein
MAKAVEAYRDERGFFYNSPADAVLADLAAAFGRVGDEGGLTQGVARLVLEKRAEIERAFADLDRLTGMKHDNDTEVLPLKMPT